MYPHEADGALKSGTIPRIDASRPQTSTVNDMFYVSEEIARKSNETTVIEISKITSDGESANSSDAIEEFLSPQRDHTRVVLFGKVIVLKS